MNIKHIIRCIVKPHIETPHSEGFNTVISGYDSHVEGFFDEDDELDDWIVTYANYPNRSQSIKKIGNTKYQIRKL